MLLGRAKAGVRVRVGVRVPHPWRAHAHTRRHARPRTPGICAVVALRQRSGHAADAAAQLGQKAALPLLLPRATGFQALRVRASRRAHARAWVVSRAPLGRVALLYLLQLLRG